jgi:hypothetical protein
MTTYELEDRQTGTRSSLHGFPKKESEALQGYRTVGPIQKVQFTVLPRDLVQSKRSMIELRFVTLYIVFVQYHLWYNVLKSYNTFRICRANVMVFHDSGWYCMLDVTLPKFCNPLKLWRM